MNIENYLWSTLDLEPNTENPQIKEFLRDIRHLRFSRILSNKNNYTSLSIFKTTNCLLRIIFSTAKNHIGETLSQKLTTFLQSISNSFSEDREFSPINVLTIILYLLHGLFMKENWVGPSYLSPNAGKIMKQTYKIDTCPKYQIDFSGDACVIKILHENNLEFHNLEPFSFNNIKLESFLKSPTQENNRFLEFDKFLRIDGEEYIRDYKLLDVFIVMRVLLKQVANHSPQFYDSHTKLLNARLSKLHSQIMEVPCKSLKDEIQSLYQALLSAKQESVSQNENTPNDGLLALCHLKIEFALSLIPFYEFKLSKKLIMEVMCLLGIEINFTGKWGVRTKYQTFKVAQLIIEVNSSKPVIDTLSDTVPTNSDTPNGPKLIPLDDIFDNILHETPVLDDLLQQSSKTQNLESNLVIMALMLHMLKSHALDDQQREKAMAYLASVISNYKDWSLMVTALISRSTLEFVMSRKMERSMLQFEQITTDWHSKDFSLLDRLKFAHVVALPSYIELISTLAQNYARISCFMSAFGLYKDLGLHCKAIECLFLSGQKGQALDYVQSLPADFREQPNILCILGEIYKDPSYFEKAIEVSKQKYAAGYRTLAGFYFNAKNFELSLDNYLKAVALNEYNLVSWLRIGFIFMNQQKNEEAISAYKKVVFMSEEESGAWTNLALLYRKIGKTQLAFNAIQKSVTLKERNWNTWYNMVIISLENKSFSWFVKGCLKLVELNKADEIKEFVVVKLFVIIEHLFQTTSSDLSLFRQTELLCSKFINQNCQIIRLAFKSQTARSLCLARIRKSHQTRSPNFGQKGNHDN